MESSMSVDDMSSALAATGSVPQSPRTGLPPQSPRTPLLSPTSVNPPPVKVGLYNVIHVIGIYSAETCGFCRVVFHKIMITMPIIVAMLCTFFLLLGDCKELYLEEAWVKISAVLEGVFFSQ